MSLINVISAIGNNNSIYPLLIRDLGIENLTKCTMTYRQNAKESKFIARQALIERFIDEYSTSALWLGGIPFMSMVCDKFIKKAGFDPKVDLKLFKETSSQGLNLNIAKFKDKAPDIVSELQKVKDNKNIFKNAQNIKFLATTAVPIAIMGFVLPKLNFLYTEKRLKQSKQNIQKTTFKPDSFKQFAQKTKNNNINFTGIENITNLQKMMILDGGLTAGRVKTGRNPAEKSELAFKMALMCYLNYLAPKRIEKILNKLTKSIFKINTDLDVKILSDKSFINQIKNNSFKLPKGQSEKEILDFIDNNINSPFVKQIENLGLVSILKENIRDPRKFVETTKIAQYKNSLVQFVKQAQNSSNIEKFVKNALWAKSFNTIANVALSSFLLAFALPKVQFIFRKIITGSNLEPGIKIKN